MIRNSELDGLALPPYYTYYLWSMLIVINVENARRAWKED